jgi:hypothetical protein
MPITGSEVLAALSTYSGPHPTGGAGSITLEPWQVINLIGAPLLALMFMAPVIDDLKAWLASIRK